MTRRRQIIGFNNTVAGGTYSNHCTSKSWFCKFHVKVTKATIKVKVKYVQVCRCQVKRTSKGNSFVVKLKAVDFII